MLTNFKPDGKSAAARRKTVSRVELCLTAGMATMMQLALCQSAQAQVNASSQPETAGDIGQLDDIVVTAQRRAENLQKTPLSVTALGADDIERKQVAAIADLPRVAPGLSFGQQTGNSRLFIRGIGLSSFATGQDPSVAFQVDGVVIGRPSAQLSSFFDIERVEVLRGPQGTLYGRNATGGSVNLITRKPTDQLEGYLSAGYGNYDAIQVNGAIGGPIDKDGKVLARVAFQRVKHDGYGRNVTLDEDVDNQDSGAARAVVVFKPSSMLTVTLTGDYAKERDHNYAVNGFGPYRDDVPVTGLLLGGVGFLNTLDLASDVPVRNRRNIWGLSGTVALDLGGGVKLQSITGYRRMRRSNQFDIDTTSFMVAEGDVIRERASQFSEELQLLYSSDRLNGVAGLFYYDESIRGEQHTSFPVLGSLLGFSGDPIYNEDGKVDVRAYAAFTQWTYQLSEMFRITGGLRYSSERRVSTGLFSTFNFLPAPDGAILNIPISQRKTWSSLTPKIGVDFSPTDRVMLYASATKGFKSGVLAVGNPNPPVNPENIWAYEAGIKTKLFDNRVELNAAAFYYDYSDLQVNRVVNNALITVNAASARVKGAEMSLRANLTRGIRVDGNVTYLDAKFTRFNTADPGRPELGELDLQGNRLPNAPSWTLNGGVEIDIPVPLPGNLSARTDVSWISKLYFSEFNVDRVVQDSVATIDGSLQYTSPDERWSATAYIKNATNKLIKANLTVAAQAVGYAVNGSYKAPRTYGFTLGYKF